MGETAVIETVPAEVGMEVRLHFHPKSLVSMTNDSRAATIVGLDLANQLIRLRIEVVIGESVEPMDSYAMVDLRVDYENGTWCHHVCTPEGVRVVAPMLD